ncbi:trypsin-like peptidase domain-containing protein [Streptomyces sp. NPDC059468]|uniref:trypsin-like peptidase domain-containing protein n=1 Tax=Streptomyces sp. NPDC059468 TaxID=3346845 RepID=UPI0036B2D31B
MPVHSASPTPPASSSSPSGVPGYLGSVLRSDADEPVGTCFQLSPGVLATACHVLERLGLAVPGAQVRFAPLAGGPSATATVERVDPAHDLAVLRTDGPLPASVTRAMPTETVEPGTELVIEGFGVVPAYEDRHTYRYLRADGRWEHTTERDDGVRLGRLRAKDLLSGMSGAPVRRTSDDAVVGVVSARYNSTDGWLRDSVWTARTEDLAALAPRELSWFSPYLRTHGQVLRDLDDKEQYLTAQRLEFVSPGPGSRSAPARLMGLLATQLQPGGYAEPQRGVLLKGVAGAGKTRTCFEVSALAERETGWLVLHAEPGAPVTAEELVQAAVAHARIADMARVLLVLDYLDSYTRIRLPDLSQELQTRDPEGRVACLASARPGALGQARDAAERLFTQVRLEDGREYRTRVAAGIFKRVAPEAWRRWDEDELLTACSDRPVLALLIALALEKQARAGQRAPDLSELRQDDLFAWLRRRLEHDFGVPTAADREAGHSRPRVSLLASAVALLACPQDRSPAVEAAVDRALDQRGDKEFALYGCDVVAKLHREGWLVGSGDRLELVHDIVADGLLDATLILDGDTVQSRTAEELFDALLDHGPVFTQAVRHLSRWTTDQKEYRQSEIETACARWLAARVGRIGELLAEDALGQTAFDLMARTPWQAGMLRLWDELVDPWLARIERERPGAMPGVLAQAVDRITDPPPQLLARAMACLEARTDAKETGVLLQALLFADGLGPDRLEAVTGRTLSWVGRYGGDRRAVQLLNAALARADLPPVTARQIVAAARDWIRRNPRHPAGSMLLVSLLEREDLGHQAKAALDTALTWTVRNNGHPGISFVLARALRREDLGVHRGRAVGLALAWLRGHATDRQATYVLRPLLRADLTDAEADQAIAYARRWLARHDDAPHGFVLCALLHRDGSVAERALELLGQQPVTEEQQYLLRALLGREDLPKAHFRQTVKVALDWLRIPGHTPNASLLHLLLRRLGPGSTTWTEVSAAAVRWMERHATGAEASLVLPDLLTADPGRADTTRFALEWLALPDADPYATYVLKPLLRHYDRLPEDALQQTVAHALRWLESRADQPEARFVIAPLLALPSLGPDEAGAAVRAATTWLAVHAATRHADRVLSPLLVCAGLPPGLRVQVKALAVEWLDRYPEEESRIGLLLPLLAEPGPGRAAGLLPRELLRAVASGSAVPVLIGLLDAVPSGTEQWERLIDHTLDWLARRRTLGNGPDDLFPRLLAHRGLAGEQLAHAAELFLAWLEPRAARPTTGRPLAELLSHTAPAPWRAAAVTQALAWLSQNAAQPQAGEVLDALMNAPDLPADRRAEVDEWAKAWRETYAPGPGGQPDIAGAADGPPGPEEKAGGGPLG